MASPLLVAVPVTILPAMAALWWLLRRYEGLFDDARVFFALIAGFFAGLLVTAFEAILFPFAHPDFVSAYPLPLVLVLFVAGYAFFENGAKAIVLGLGRFRGRKDTPYYGAPLGLGLGAMAALLFVARGLSSAANQAQAYELSTTRFVLLSATAIAVPVGAIFAHGATGIYVGRGSAQGDLRKGWVQGTLFQMPVLGAYWLAYSPNDGSGLERLLLAAVISIGYGVSLLWLADKRVLDPIVPAAVRARVRRDLRRQRRGEEVDMSWAAAARPEPDAAGPNAKPAPRGGRVAVSGAAVTVTGSDVLLGEEE